MDPGVGTKRRPIIVDTNRSCFVEPDNGLLFLAASRESIRHVYAIKNPRYMLPRISKTFHGRDIFAPAAACLAKGFEPSDFGKVENYEVPSFADPHLLKKAIYGEVLHVDSFGNIITNVCSGIWMRGTQEPRSIRVRIGKERTIIRVCSAYSNVPIGSPLAVIGSHGFLEIAANQTSAAGMFKVKSGDPICIRSSDQD